jgi:hypothetical protein
VADTQPERIAENEANARELNEKFGLGTFICECGNSACRQVLGVSREVYSAVRADPHQFIVAAGHELPDTEDVVREHEGFNVVRKHEDVAPIVEARDPRGG